MPPPRTIATPGTSYDVELGDSFAHGGKGHHTLRYSFKPAHVKWAERGKLSVRGDGVEVSMPAACKEGSIVFQGRAASAKTSECLLVYRNGQWTLERVGSNFINLKVSRIEPSKERAVPAPSEPAEPEAKSAPSPPPAAAEKSAIAEEEIDEADLFGDSDDDEGVVGDW